MTAEEYLNEKGIHPHEPIFWYSGTDYLTISQAMEDYAKVYANQKLDQAAEICLETKSDNREYFDNFPNADWELDNNGHLFRGNKNGILALKDDI